MGQHQSDPVTRWLVTGARNASFVVIGATFLALGFVWAGICGVSGQPQMEIFGLAIAGLGAAIVASGRPRTAVICVVLLPFAVIIAGAAILLALGIPRLIINESLPPSDDDYGLMAWATAPTPPPPPRYPPLEPQPESLAIPPPVEPRAPNLPHPPGQEAPTPPDRTVHVHHMVPTYTDKDGTHFIDRDMPDKEEKLRKLKAEVQALEGGDAKPRPAPVPQYPPPAAVPQYPPPAAVPQYPPPAAVPQYPPHVFGHLSLQTQVHLVGIYEADRTLQKPKPPGVTGNRYGEINVNVTTPMPVVLVLTSYEPVKWMIHAAPHAQICGVILNGYYPQLAEADVPGIPVRNLSGYKRNPQYFYAYNDDSPTLASLEVQVVRLTGLPQQNIYHHLGYSGFDIDIDRDVDTKITSPTAPPGQVFAAPVDLTPHPGTPPLPATIRVVPNQARAPDRLHVTPAPETTPDGGVQ